MTTEVSNSGCNSDKIKMYKGVRQLSEIYKLSKSGMKSINQKLAWSFEHEEYY